VSDEGTTGSFCTTSRSQFKSQIFFPPLQAFLLLHAFAPGQPFSRAEDVRGLSFSDRH